MIRSVTIIGAGNVAVHLGRAIRKLEQMNVKLYTRKQDFSSYDDDIRPLLSNDEAVFSQKSDLFIIAVNDDSIADVAAKIRDYGQMVVHTSGSTAMEVLKSFRNHGVFYPLQTFSANRQLDFSEVPVFLEVSGGETEKELGSFAARLSTKVSFLNSIERMKLHVSAVFVSNFVNHMFVQAKEITDRQGVDFRLLLPLINETIDKLQVLSPQVAQTGPAIRNDRLTMAKHLHALGSDEMKHEIYHLISKSIYQKSREEQAGDNSAEDIEE